MCYRILPLHPVLMLLLCLLLACKPDNPPESGDTGDCTLWCPNLDSDAAGEITALACRPRCAPEPPDRPLCRYTVCPE